MDVKVKSYEISDPKTAVKGMATIDLGDKLRVRSVTIREGKNGLFVSMPKMSTSRVDEKGQTVYTDVFHPITSQASKDLTKAVLESYETGQEVLIKDETDRNGNDLRANMVPLTNTKSNALAIGKLYVNDSYVVNTVTVLNSDKIGEYVRLPFYKSNEVDEQGNTVYKDFVYPVDKDARDLVSALVMDSYREAKELAETEVTNEAPETDKETLKEESSKGVKAKLKDGEAKKNEANAKTSRSKSKEAQLE